MEDSCGGCCETRSASVHLLVFGFVLCGFVLVFLFAAVLYRDSLSKDALVKTVRGLAEGTARFLANSRDQNTRLTFKGGEEELEVFIGSWVQFCNKTPRQADAAGTAIAAHTPTTQSFTPAGAPTRYVVVVNGFKGIHQRPCMQLRRSMHAYDALMLKTASSVHSCTYYRPCAESSEIVPYIFRSKMCPGT